MTVEELNELVCELAKCRRVAANYEELVRETQSLLEQTDEWQQVQGLREKATAAHAAVVELENDIRVAALEVYDATHEKHPLPDVQIKMFTEYAYEAVRAKAYCIAHDIPGALKLDTKAFEKMAVVLGLEWVHPVEMPKVYISSVLKVQ